MAVEKVLTNEYYTRYHIWRDLVKQAGDLPAETISQLAEEGYAFVWRDGEDVEVEKDLEELRGAMTPEAPSRTGGSYL